MAYQCPYCLASLVGVAPVNGTTICPTCQQPSSELETFSVASPRLNTRPTKPKSTNKLLIPLGYAAFVIVPGLIAIALLIYYTSKPAEVEADKGTPAPEQPIQVAKTNAEPVPKKTQTPSSNEKPQKNTSATNLSAPDSSKQKPDSSSNSKDSSISSKINPPMDSKEDVSSSIITLEVAPPPRAKLVFGTLRLVTSVAVKEGVEAWVEIEGKKEKVWKPGTFQVELKLIPGEYKVKVIAIYKGVRRIIYESDAEITANKVKEVSVDPAK
jgi:hypothetical protein